MTILFLNGWRAVPGGVKPTFLARRGHEVIEPKLPDDDFAEAVAIAQAAFDRHRPRSSSGCRGAGRSREHRHRRGAAGAALPGWKR